MKSSFLRALRLTAKPQTLFETIWLGAPLAIWFSFQPLIRFGTDKTMYFELSIAVVYVALLGLASLPVIWRHRRLLYRSFEVRLVAPFVLLTMLGLLWSVNPTRAILTVGIIGLLFAIFLASLARAKQLRQLLPVLVRIFIMAAVIMSILSIVQFVAGIWLARDVTLLCAGCVAEQFGYPRPNVFTIEPQFFGNALLAPALLLLHLVISKKRDALLLSGLFIVTIALCLTLSRGALFAFAAGAIVLFVLHRRAARRIVASVVVLLLGLVTSLGMQGLAAEFNPTVHETFGDAIAKTVNQLSLGIVDISVDEPAVESQRQSVPKFDGYVEESTDIRLNLSEMAIKTWSQDPFRVLFGVGVGVGGSGVAMHQAFPGAIDARQIVQNEYLEILLEMGLVGLMIFAMIIAGLIYRLRATKWLWAAILAYLIQWYFFSGYPNALHIYLVFIMCTIYTTGHRDRSAPASQS